MENNTKEKLIKLINQDSRYQVFRKNKFIEKYIDDALVFKDKNETSIGFKKEENKNIFNILCEIFEIKDIETFKTKFDEAVSGDGRELNNMLTIWSSSLCALLCFYNVSKYPLELNIDGKSYFFNEVHFEVKNKVLSNPSNVDIVLLDRKNKCILFLESKFAEYLKYDKNTISDEYFEYLKKIDDEVLVQKLTNKTDNTIYHYGVKQLLTHYIGLDHFTNDSVYSYHKDDERSGIFKFYKEVKGVKVFLQEIVFNNDTVKKDEYFENLIKLEKILNWNKKVTVLTPTTYQNLLSSYDGINTAINEFYKLNNM